MPFICRECGQYYNQDSSVGFECVNCGETGTIERCKPIEFELDQKEQECKLIKNAQKDPNWDAEINYKLCQGDCNNCTYKIIKKGEKENGID